MSSRKQQGIRLITALGILFSMVLWTGVLAQDDGASLVEQGQAALDAGDTVDAFALFEQARDAFREAGDTAGEGTALLGMGAALYAQGDFLESQYDYEAALVIYRQQAPDRGGEARALLGLGRAYQARGRLDDALAFLRQGASTASAGLELEVEAEIRLALGDLFIERGEFDNAVSAYEQASSVYFQLIDDTGQAEALYRVGRANFAGWSMDQAIFALMQSAGNFAALGLRDQEARSIQSIGEVYHHRGDMRAARENYETALTIYEETGNDQERGRVLSALGNVYNRLGFLNALQTLQSALQIHQQTGDETARAMTFNYIGDYYYERGEYPSAFTNFDNAFNIAQLLEDVNAEAYALNGLARVYAFSDIQPWPIARDNFGFASDRYRYELSDPWGTRRVFTDQAIALMEQDQPADALSLFQQSRREMQLVGDTRGEIEAIVALAVNYYVVRGEYDDARREYDDALRLVETVDAPYLNGEILRLVADLDILETQYADAIDRYQSALEIYQTEGDTLLTAVALDGLGRARVLVGDVENALRDLDEAERLLSSMGGDFVNVALLDSTQASINISRAQLMLEVGLTQEAITLLADAVAQYNQQGNDYGRALALVYLGDAYFEVQDYANAQNRYREANSVAVAVANRNIQAEGRAALGLARIFVQRGADRQDITGEFNRAIQLLRDDVRDYAGLRSTYYYWAQYYLDQQEPQLAFDRLAEAQRQAAFVGDTRGEALIHLQVGEARIRNRDFDIAVREYQAALSKFQQATDVRGEATALLALGDIQFSRAQYVTALDTFEQMRLAYVTLDDTAGQAIALTRRGQVLQARGEFEGAQQAYEDARDLLNNEDIASPLYNRRLNDQRLAEVDRSQGDLFRRLGNFTEADRLLTDAEFRQSGLDQQAGRARTLIAQGDLALATFNLTEALRLFTEARTLATNASDTFAEGQAYYGIARVHTQDDNLADFRQETDNYLSALDIFRNQAPNPAWSRLVTIDLAGAYLENGDLRQAEEWFNSARNEARETQNAAGEGYALMALANLRREQRFYDNAINLYREAITWFQRAEDYVGEGEAIQGIADLYLLRVDRPRAVEQYQQMIALYQSNEDTIRTGQAFILLGQVYFGQSRLALALDQSLEGLALVQSVVGEIDFQTVDVSTIPLRVSAQIQVLRSIATIQISLGEFEEARENLLLALELAQLSGNRIEEAIAKQFLGNIAMLDSDEASRTDEFGTVFPAYRYALNQYQDALDLIERRGNASLLAQLYIDIGDARLVLASSDEGTINDFTQAGIDYELALGQARSTSDRLLEAEAQASIGRARVRIDQNEAELRFQTALNVAREINARTLEFEVLVDLGLLYERNGDLNQATRLYEESIALIEDIHADIRLQRGQTRFAAENIFPYHRLVARLAESDPEGAFNIAERGRARTFLFQIINEQIDFGSGVDADRLAQWQDARIQLLGLQDQLTALQSQQEGTPDEETQRQIGLLQQQIIAQERQVENLLGSSEEARSVLFSQLAEVKTVSLQQVRDAMGDDTTMIAYYVVPESIISDPNAVYAFIIGPNNLFEAVPLNIPANEVESLVTSLRRSAQAPGDADLIDEESLRDFYDRFVGPFEHLLTTERLVIAPNNQLNYVPFAALLSENGYMGERFDIAYAQSATFYVRLAEQRQERELVDRLSGLVLGNPIPDGQLSLGTLAFATDEAEAVACTLTNQDDACPPGLALTLGAATEAAVTNQAETVDVLHIAAHGRFNAENPLSSFLALTPGADAAGVEYDGILEVREIYSLDLSRRSPLVVLSACDTATGNLTAGDEFEGLARSFLLSGARGVVASLWQVDDRATTTFMEAFYAEWMAGASEDEALSAAQEVVRSNPDWASPYYWAAFVLLGAP